MSIWVEIVFGLILLSTIVLVIAENKHPVKTLAWLMVLVFLPVVGLVLYFLFGIDHLLNLVCLNGQLFVASYLIQEMYF